MLAESVRTAAQRFGNLVALVDPDGRSVTYSELDRASDAAAAGLAHHGIGEGDIVALTLPSSSSYAIAYVAAAKVGAVTAGVNPRYTPSERAKALEVISPKVVVGDADVTQGGEATVDRLSPDPGRPVAIVLTSGTTGTPRGAVFCERQLTAIASMDWGESWGGGAAMLSSTEFAHVGFMTKFPWYVRAGMRIHILARWRAADALRTIAEQHIPSVGAIGSQVALMLRDPSFDAYDFSSVETIVAGGGPSSAALVREARRRFGAAYSIRYSSTESGGIGTATAFDAPDEEALHTVGRPRPGVEIEIRDPEGRRANAGDVGELCLRSPSMMSGYHNDPLATSVAVRDGWLHSGDLGWVDDLGCVRLAGRTKEMFVRGGYNVYPAEVEAVLLDHPDVAAVAVIPREDAVMGEIGVAVVVPRNPARPPALDALRAFASSKLAAYKLPEALRIVDDLPLTPVHKVDRAKLALD